MKKDDLPIQFNSASPMRKPDEILKEISGSKDKREAIRGIDTAKRDLSLYHFPEMRPELAGERLPRLNWGGTAVPLDNANLHFLVAGVPGTGKTISFRMLMQSILSPDFVESLPGNDRAVIYDPKQEFYPILRGMGLDDQGTRIHIMNPFDARCHGWDLAADYTTAADAFQLAKTIIPCPENSQQPFFPKAAASILTAVITVYQKKTPRNWDLASLISTCTNFESLEKTFRLADPGPYVTIAKNVFGSADTKNNVMAELCSQLFGFMPIAARWRVAKLKNRLVSLKKFIEKPNDILLLGANQSNSEALQTINRLLIKRLSEITLDHPAAGQWEARNRTWLILDELRELGKLQGLGDMINKGRSRGICAVLGFQDYPGLKESFGEHVAHEITATCGHKLYLKLGGESAEWASKAIGEVEFLETNFSVSAGSNQGMSVTVTDSVGGSSGPNGSSSTWNRSTGVGGNIGYTQNVTKSTQIQRTDAVFASEIAHLPSFREGGGLHGFLCENSADGKPVVHRLKVDRKLLIDKLRKESNDPGYLPCPEIEQDLGYVLRIHRRKRS